VGIPPGRTDEVVQDSGHEGEVELSAEAPDGRWIEDGCLVEFGVAPLMRHRETPGADVDADQTGDAGLLSQVRQDVARSAADVDQRRTRRLVLVDEPDRPGQATRGVLRRAVIEVGDRVVIDDQTIPAASGRAWQAPGW
jgi:hypothetical protein